MKQADFDWLAGGSHNGSPIRAGDLQKWPTNHQLLAAVNITEQKAYRSKSWDWLQIAFARKIIGFSGNLLYTETYCSPKCKSWPMLQDDSDSEFQSLFAIQIRWPA